MMSTKASNQPEESPCTYFARTKSAAADCNSIVETVQESSERDDNPVHRFTVAAVGYHWQKCTSQGGKKVCNNQVVLVPKRLRITRGASYNRIYRHEIKGKG